ncbi:MAG: hypothetical protein IJY99_02575 [Alphaproteobacteria bacterium]|nr:hypothetical protein [Alphaproteobacteria bacterium]
MSKKQKIKIATRRIKNKRSFWKRVWNIICWPFRMIAKLCRKIWNWICGLNLVAMVNLTLLIAIIVLFSMLIMDVIGCRKQQVIVVAKPATSTQQIEVTDASAPRSVKPRKVTLPLATDSKTRKKAETVNVVPVKRAEVEIAKKQTAKQNDKFWGDIIVDSRGAGAILTSGAQVNGNLYVQNMRKYTLPCDIRINGNLFLRDVNMLQFCGDFVVTGNIYVSPRSSFGPIPKTARVGGHVVL